MKLKSSYAAVLTALLLVGGSTPGQDSRGPQPKRARTPEDYKERSLKEVVAKGDDAGGRWNKEETVIVHGDILASRVRARYDGAARPFPQERREVLRQWARLYAGAPETYTQPYETEVLFTDDGAQHWLAVRKRDLARLGQELKRGETAELFLIRVGAAKTPGGWEPVLLVENFQKLN